MSSIPSLFDSFDNLDTIDPGSLLNWLKGVPVSSYNLEDYLANKILYPQTIPQSVVDMKIDLAILREALRINTNTISEDSLLGGTPFLNSNLRKVIIPAKFLNHTPNIVTLAWAFVDGLFLDYKKKDTYEDLWTVVLSSDIDETVGSILLPEFKGLGEIMNISLNGREYKIKSGSLTRIPCGMAKIEIDFKLSKGTFLNKNTGVIEIFGGELGLLVDGRIR